MISKDEFLKAIAVLKKQSEVDDNFDEHMCAAFPGSYAPIYDNKLWELSVHLLGLLMDDPYEYVDWWVWETHYGENHPNVYWNNPDGTQEKEWYLDTPEALYDFLVENAKRPESEEEVMPDPNVKTMSMDEFMQTMEKELLKKK